MIRIWAKTIKGHKIEKSYIYESIDTLRKETLWLHLQQICHNMDLPTPVVLPYHENTYAEFGSCRFLPRDFVESVDFDKFEIEDATIK